MKRVKQFVLRLPALLGVSMLQFTGALYASENVESRPVWSMPKQADALHLAWVKGPPQMQVFIPIDKHLAGFRDEAALLGFRSERWGMLLDPRKMTLEALTLSDTQDAVADLLDYSRIRQQWSKGHLELTVECEGKVYRAQGGAIRKDDRLYSPIHIVESGDWFQHVAIYDLDLVDEAGDRLPAKGKLEIRAWGDRCLFEWAVIPKQSRVLTTRIALRADEHGAVKPVESIHGAVRMCVDLSGDRIRPGKTVDESILIHAKAKDDFSLGIPKVRYSEQSDSWEVTIPKQHWPADPGVAFNKRLLDRISHFDLKLENRSDQPRDVRIRFIHDYHPISGYVPMILDDAGDQTGLPIQNSKNWHSLPNKPYPYQGTWINLTTRFRLEPHASVDWQYVVVHAQWHGLPASSAAQLSLVGWGYNGFWTQMALGSWGETLCLQPGRTMRRAFITDVRPFMVHGATGKPYDWTNNVGGGDIAKFVDEHGKLITWQGAVREYGMIGPNLSHIRVKERSAQNRMRLQIDTYLPRSNSINRSYFKVKLDVLEDIGFQECALFQLGSDYYNELDSEQLAWGAKDGLVGKARPAAGEWGRVMEPVHLNGRQPWVSLYDNSPQAKVNGRGVRGMIVRDYLATLDGKVYKSPWLVATRNQSRLNAELVPEPNVRSFKAGDSIEFTVEMDIFPMSADVYYGPDQGLKARMEATPDSWELTAYESAQQSLRLNGADTVFPAVLAYDGARRQQFHVSSGSSMDTVCVTGLTEPGTWRIGEWIDGEYVELGKRCLLYTSPSPRDRQKSRMPSSA